MRILSIVSCSLARISHHNPAKTSPLPASAASSSVGLINGLFKAASVALGRFPCIHRIHQHSRRFFSCHGERCGLVLVLAAAGLLMPVERSLAGTALRMGVAELTRAADLILEARVLNTRTYETAPGRIETEFMLSVDRTLQGQDAPVRFLRLPGGVLPDGRGLLIPGLNLPRAGEEVLLFLSQETKTGWRMPIGLAQGQFRLIARPGGGRLAVRTQGDLGWIDRAGELREAEGTYAMDYAELCAEVERARAWRKLEEAQQR